MSISKSLKSVLVIVMALAVLLSGCGDVKELTKRGPVEEYHVLVTAYQQAQMAAAGGNTCLSLTFAQMTNQVILANNFMSASVEYLQAYREPLAEYGNQIVSQQQAYVDDEGQPIPVQDLDLNQLVQQGATPADLGLTIQVYASTFTEAPVPPLNAEPVINAQRMIAELTNQSMACVYDWNEAVRVYNTERGKVPGDAVGSIASALGVSDLPETLPYFTMAAPSSPPTVPVFSGQ